MKRFLLPFIVVLLTPACTIIKDPNHVLLTGANAKVQPVVIKQVIIQPVYTPRMGNDNMAQSVLTNEEYNNLFISPYTYPYRRTIPATNK